MLQILCLFFMIKFIVMGSHPWWLRLMTLAIAVGQFFIPYVVFLGFAWGTVCWLTQREMGKT